MKKQAFTLIELIFVIVLIGVLSSVAIPKFSHINDNAKISAELSTAASVQSAIDSCHGEWIINEGSFICGKDIDGENNLTDEGYPKNSVLSDTNPLDRILKNANNIGWTKDGTKYRGPASRDDKGTADCKTNKPCTSKYWDYNETAGSFTLVDE